MNEVENVTIQCPYCWQKNTIVVDCSISAQDYIEDCEVCCQPIEMHVVVDEKGQPSVVARHENECALATS